LNLDLAAAYERRFAGDAAFRNEMWRILCRRFFQAYIDPGATVLEVGAGHCEFINNVIAGRKIAVDINPQTPHHAAPDVTVIRSSSTNLGGVADHSVDVVFASNFFEHLSRPDILATLREMKRLLRGSGRILILQPNIRYCYRDYWMFFDHVTPLDDRSLTEALENSGFVIERLIRRFLPFTTKGRLPQSLALLRIYVSVPLLWRVFGAQSFVAARPGA
jgi:ubiquinone/menaquinone biosynthesis C-methylase UbiE